MSLDEFEIIKRYFKVVGEKSAGVVLGPGDDCAVLSFSSNEEVCVTTDTLIEGVHFPENCEASMVASRLIGANLSDIAAMGALPHSCLIALTLPEADTNWLEGFSATLGRLLERYGLTLAGGNISKGTLSITMTVLGSVPTGEALTRGGAMPGDEIYVTGTLGDAKKGLTDILSGRKSSGYLAGRYSTPTPRLEIGRELRGLATAMIDISDGLFADLSHLCQASQAGAVVELGSIPVSNDLVSAIGDREARSLALNSGDDYELCFTVPSKFSLELHSLEKKSGLPITRVGCVRTAEGIDVLDMKGDRMDIANLGYRHF